MKIDDVFTKNYVTASIVAIVVLIGGLGYSIYQNNQLTKHLNSMDNQINFLGEQITEDCNALLPSDTSNTCN